MTDLTITIFQALFTIGITLFIIFRLKIGRLKEFEGAGFVYGGTAILIFFALANVIRQLPGYDNWFLSGVYPVISIAQALMLMSGIVLYIIGLIMHFNFFGDRDIEVSNHLEKIRLLDNIQRESRYPFPMLELLDKVLKSMLAGLGEEAGAIFLLNSDNKKFVLATGSGLSKEETALLEYYPYGRNVITQSIEDESPLITSDFRSFGGKAQLAASRFRSMLIVPIISGRSKLGALVLFSVEDNRYSREFITIINPITEWLAEKIEVNRLGREIKKGGRELSAKRDQLKMITGQLQNIIRFSGGTPTVNEFVERCVGLSESDEVLIAGVETGQLQIHGQSNINSNLSENFKTALINAIGKNKAIILNQESADENGTSFISKSSLMIPIDRNGNFILFRRSNSLIQVSGEELSLLEIVASLAGLVVATAKLQEESVARSRGIKAISDTFKISIVGSHLDKAFRSFSLIIEDLFGKNDLVIFFRNDENELKIIGDEPVQDALGVSIPIGESSIGRAMAMKTESVLMEQDVINENISGLNESAETYLRNLLGEKRIPSFEGDYPITIGDRTAYMISIFSSGGHEKNNMEKHRLLSLLVGLINLRMEIFNRNKIEVKSSEEATDTVPAEQINMINNNLSAVLGYCQLMKNDPNLLGTTEKTIDAIIGSIDALTGNIRFLDISSNRSIAKSEPNESVLEIIKDAFKSNIIYGNLYKVGDKALTVNLSLNKLPEENYSLSGFEKLFQEVVYRFSEFIEEDEILTISTYTYNQTAFIDFSKHRDKFPPISNIAKFGEYLPGGGIDSQVLNNDIRELLKASNIEFAYDRQSRSPSYISLKFAPLTATENVRMNNDANILTVLAVDDQTVILDLISAMCQSLGYKIYTARNGEEGIKLFNHFRPDLVISDLAMPGMSGWEMSTKIKVISPGTPIIIITGWGVSVDQEKMQEIGVDYVLHKPFRFEQLSELISKINFSHINK